MNALQFMLMTSTALVVSEAIAETDPVGTTFTYQGRLTEAGEPVSEPIDLVFRSFGQATGGAPLSVLAADDFEIGDDGRFTIDLDFGDEFTGAARWLPSSSASLAPTAYQPRLRRRRGH